MWSFADETNLRFLLFITLDCLNSVSFKVIHRNRRERERSLTSSLVAATVGVAINKAWTALLWELSAGLEYIFDQSDGLDDSTCCVNYRKAWRQLSPAPYAKWMVRWMCAVDMCGNSQRLHLKSKPRLPHRIQRLFSVEVQTQSPFQSIFDCRCACQSSDLEGNRHSHVIRPGDGLTWQTRSESLQEQLSSPKRRNHQGMSGKD